MCNKCFMICILLLLLLLGSRYSFDVCLGWCRVEVFAQQLLELMVMWWSVVPVTGRICLGPSSNQVLVLVGSASIFFFFLIIIGLLHLLGLDGPPHAQHPLHLGPVLPDDVKSEGHLVLAHVGQEASAQRPVFWIDR